MSAEVITAAISLVGTLVGTLGGIALSSIKRPKSKAHLSMCLAVV